MVLHQEKKALIWSVLICVSSQNEKRKEIILEKAMTFPKTECC